MAQQPASSIAVPWEEATQEADQALVRPIFREGVAPQELVGLGFTTRVDWGNKHGGWVLHLNWGAVNAMSRVFAAVSEGATGGPDAGKFIGAAKFTLNNVAPRPGGVDIWVDINWGSDIRIYVDLLELLHTWLEAEVRCNSRYGIRCDPGEPYEARSLPSSTLNAKLNVSFFGGRELQSGGEGHERREDEFAEYSYRRGTESA